MNIQSQFIYIYYYEHRICYLYYIIHMYFTFKKYLLYSTVYNICDLYTSLNIFMYSYASLSIMSSNGGISSYSLGMKSWTIPCISIYNWNSWFSKFSRLEIVTCIACGEIIIHPNYSRVSINVSF